MDQQPKPRGPRILIVDDTPFTGDILAEVTQLIEQMDGPVANATVGIVDSYPGSPEPMRFLSSMPEVITFDELKSMSLVDAVILHSGDSPAKSYIDLQRALLEQVPRPDFEQVFTLTAPPKPPKINPVGFKKKPEQNRPFYLGLKRYRGWR